MDSFSDMGVFSDILTDDETKTLNRLLDQPLPILVADDDFLEYLREHTYEELNSLELDELIMLWHEWEKENVE